MKKQVDLYKVLWHRGTGELQSATARGHVVEYIPDQPATPEKGDGPLAAFATYDDAWTFLAPCTPPLYHQIWKCKGVVSRKKDLWVGCDESTRFYKFAADLPQGTVLCDEITITERIL